MKISKCKEKYGREWSKELTQTTRKCFEDFTPGIFKHIGGKPNCIVIDLAVFIGDEDEEEIMTGWPDYHGERYMFLDANEGDYIKYYNTVDEIIDDGWVVD